MTTTWQAGVPTLTELPSNGSTVVGRRWTSGLIKSSSVALWISVGWMTLIGAFALVPGLIAPGDVLGLRPDRVLEAPGNSTLLGTDQFGRSLFALIVHGTRISIFIGLGATAIAVVLGSLLGIAAGYFGRHVDMLVSRGVDVLMCFPGVLLALVISTALGPSAQNLMVAVGIGSTPVFARVMRGQVMSVASRPYIDAAHSIGSSHLRTLTRHVVPNSVTPIIVMTTIQIGDSIVAAAALSFLGAGLTTGIPDWGRTISQGQPYLNTAWWLTTITGLVLTLTVVALSLVGDWLRDRLDRA